MDLYDVCLSDVCFYLFVVCCWVFVIHRGKKLKGSSLKFFAAGISSVVHPVSNIICMISDLGDWILSSVKL